MIFEKIIIILLTLTPLSVGHIGVFSFWSKDNTTVARKTISLKTSSKVPKEPLKENVTVFATPTTAINNTFEKTSYYVESLPDSKLVKIKGCDGAGPPKTDQEIDETGDCTLTTKPSTTKKTNTTVDKSTIACTCTAIGTTSTIITTSTTISSTATTGHDGLEIFDRKNDKDASRESSTKVPKASTNPLTRKTTVTITNIRAYTVYQSPRIRSCLEMKDVKSFCDGKLITISPTATFKKGFTRYKREFGPQGKMNYEVLERPDDYDPDPVFITPTSVIPQMTQSSFPDLHELPFTDNIVESSKEDLDFEEIKISYEHWLRLSNPRIRFETRYIRNTVTKSLLDSAITATVVAKNCLPQDLNLPFCNSASAITSLKSIMNANVRI